MNVRKRLAATLAAVAAMMALGGCAAAHPTAVDTVIGVDGQRVSLHDADSSQARPLVLALHGLGSTGAAFAQLTGLSAFADQHGFAVAYPDAHPAPHVLGLTRGSSANSGRAWNAGDCCGDASANDVAYLVDVVAAAAQHTKIDKHRVYVIGLSNGGMMALRAICDAPTVFAAAGSVAGPYLGQTCRRPVWRHLHGGADPVVPFHGGISPGSAYLGVPANWCGCSFPDSATEPQRFSKTTVSVVFINHGLHTWPKPADGSWNLYGNQNLWSYISRYSL